MKQNFLTSIQIQSYQEDGVIVLRNVFTNWIKKLQLGFEKVANNPSEYGTATIEVHKDSIQKNENVLIIDDLIATGGTAEAAAKLVEISGGKVACFVFVINLFDLSGCDNLIKNTIRFIFKKNFF